MANRMRKGSLNFDNLCLRVMQKVNNRYIYYIFFKYLTMRYSSPRRVFMRNIIFGVLLSLVSAKGFARVITCSDVKTNKQVLFLVDDLGSVVESSITIGNKSCEIEENDNYLFYYGGALSLRQECAGLDVRILASDIKTESIKRGTLVATSNDGIQVINLKCQE